MPRVVAVVAGHLQRTPPTRNHPKGGWEARWQEDVNGRPKWRGRTLPTKREAERHLAAVVTDIARGEHVAALDHLRKFNEVADLWVSSLGTTRREKTVHGYLSVLKVHVLPRWAHVRLSAITHNEVQSWIDQQLVEGKSAAQITKGYRVLRMVLGRAVKAGWLRANPCASDLDLPRMTRREMLFLTAEQVEALANAFLARKPTSNYDWRTGPREDLAIYVRFAAYTGLRVGEICALRIKNVDLRTGRIHVREAVSTVGGRLVPGLPKTNAGTRTVGLPASLIPELRRYAEPRLFQPEAYLFVGEAGGQFLHANFYGRHWKPAVRAAGLPEHLRFHDLRHTYASLLVRAGVHVKEMSTLMGHASAQITLDRYSHMWEGAEIEVAQRLDAMRQVGEG